MQAFGAPQEEIELVRARLEADASAAPVQEGFGVYADNWAAVVAFQALAPRWQYAGMAGQRTGLDWAGVEAWIDRHCRRRLRRALSFELQTMERAVLHADHEKREKEE